MHIAAWGDGVLLKVVLDQTMVARLFAKEELDLGLISSWFLILGISL
jgi:hypothetical protein